MRSTPRLLLLAGLALLTASSAFGQSVANYAPVTRTTGITYTSISGTGTSVVGWRNALSTDDNRSQPQAIGFTFYYDGRAFTTFCISTNGYMDLSSSTAVGSGTGAYGYDNINFSATSGTLLALAPLYDDLVCQGNPGTQASLDATFKYQVDGSPGSRVLTVQWTSMEVFNNAGPDLNFQVKLYEATGVIEYVYGTMTASTATYTYSVGVNGPTMSASPLASELLTQQTQNSATFSNTPANALSTIPVANTKLTFTPSQSTSPAAPISMTFSSVTQTSMTVGWTDNSTTETFFAVSRSTDDITYTPVGNVASTTTGATGGTYSLAQSGLSAGVTYYFHVTAGNEATAPSGGIL